MSSATKYLSLLLLVTLLFTACAEETSYNDDDVNNGENNNTNNGGENNGGENNGGENNGGENNNNGVNNPNLMCEGIPDQFAELYVEAKACQVDFDCVIREDVRCYCGGLAASVEADLSDLQALQSFADENCPEYSRGICDCAPVNDTRCQEGSCQVWWEGEFSCGPLWQSYHEVVNEARRCQSDDECIAINSPTCGQRGGCYIYIGAEANPDTILDSAYALAAEGCADIADCDCGPDPELACVNGLCRATE